MFAKPVLTSLPAWRETHRAETTSTDRASQVFPRDCMKIWFLSHIRRNGAGIVIEYGAGLPCQDQLGRIL
jgi:hypothetical protein